MPNPLRQSGFVLVRIIRHKKQSVRQAADGVRVIGARLIHALLVGVVVRILLIVLIGALILIVLLESTLQSPILELRLIAMTPRLVDNITVPLVTTTLVPLTSPILIKVPIDMLAVIVTVDKALFYRKAHPSLSLKPRTLVPTRLVACVA